ncbi:MAG: FAD-binding oxidoreductase [Sphingomonas sp.]|nr:FAD-binding oxidoreductase [Sphingomonas sp.]
MSRTSDIIIVGGGVAGLSAAAALAPHARVILLEAEEQTGFHSSGRSATMFHYALGNRAVRALTKASRDTFDNPPAAFEAAPAHSVPILVHARGDELEALDRTEADMAPFTSLERLDEQAMAQMCPILKLGDGGAVRGLADLTALRIDQHALMQGYVRQLRASGGLIVTGQRAAAIAQERGTWTVTTAAKDTYSAPLLVNAAGAWADEVAQLAGVAPVGIRPLRRTIITFDAPAGVDPARLPFVKTVGDELYFSGESGRLFASPMDEGESAPCDSQPDEVDIATAAWRMEQRTSVAVRDIRAKWSGLRSFAPDGVPVLGFAPDGDGFMWCAGQGGSGLQTSPAAAAVVAALITGGEWPIADLVPEELGPGRFLRQAV